MHILIASPHFDEWRGNKITAERMQKGLEKRGVEVSIVSSTEENPSIPEAYDIVHGFHAYKFGLFRKKMQLNSPYILTLTGTDMNVNIDEPDKSDFILTTLKEAARIHVFDENMKKKVKQYVPEAVHKISVLPQSVEVREQHWKQQRDPFIFFLPAGIREVKNITGAIEMVAALAEEFPLELWLAGPKLEESEYEKVMQEVEYYDWIHYKGEVPYDRMFELYQQSDAVLNTSISEGQSSAILEAMAANRPVLAADIPGNRGVIKHNYSGLLYGNTSQFHAYGAALAKDENLRIRLSKNAYHQVSEENNPQKETDTLLEWYNAATKETRF